MQVICHVVRLFSDSDVVQAGSGDAIEDFRFDPKDIKNPTAPENILKESGRGVFIVKALMDDVLFRFSEKGNYPVMQHGDLVHDFENLGNLMCHDHAGKCQDAVYPGDQAPAVYKGRLNLDVFLYLLRHFPGCGI